MRTVKLNFTSLFALGSKPAGVVRFEAIEETVASNRNVVGATIVVEVRDHAVDYGTFGTTQKVFWIVFFATKVPAMANLSKPPK